MHQSLADNVSKMDNSTQQSMHRVTGDISLNKQIMQRFDEILTQKVSKISMESEHKRLQSLILQKRKSNYNF